MSTNINRKKLNKAINGSDYKKLKLADLYPMYWDECCVFYPRHHRGTNHSQPKLWSYQIRMYKTWKHNRAHQWK